MINNILYERKRKEIIEAYLFLRENNHTIPDDTLNFIKESALNALVNEFIKNESVV